MDAPARAYQQTLNKLIDEALQEDAGVQSGAAHAVPSDARKKASTTSSAATAPPPGVHTRVPTDTVLIGRPGKDVATRPSTTSVVPPELASIRASSARLMRRDPNDAIDADELSRDEFYLGIQLKAGSVFRQWLKRGLTVDGPSEAEPFDAITFDKMYGRLVNKSTTRRVRRPQ